MSKASSLSANIDFLSKNKFFLCDAKNISFCLTISTSDKFCFFQILFLSYKVSLKWIYTIVAMETYPSLSIFGSNLYNWSFDKDILYFIFMWDEAEEIAFLIA